jgi:putative phosphoribosyl transferase
MNASFQPYRDRTEAGRALGRALGAYAGRSDTVVLGLPRGGVPVALEVALALHAPLDVFLVRKLGLPSQPELAMGAIASGGAWVVNEDVLRESEVSREELEATFTREAAELRRREALYRAGRPALRLKDRVVLVIDDGLATGASMRAAVQAITAQQPARLVAGVPVGAPDSVEALESLVDEMVCPLRPDPFHAVGVWYEHFDQTSDAEVRRCLAEAELQPHP